MTRKVASDRLAMLALVAAAGVTAVYGLTSLALPFGWDHGTMASVGGSYVHGGMPYVDSWDVKGPTAYLPYALVQALFGPTMWGARIFELILAGLASYVFYKALRPLTSAVVGVWAAFALYYWVASAGWFFTATPETWTGALCILAVAPLLNPDRRLTFGGLALSGLLIGLIGLNKPFYLAMGLAPLLSIAAAPGITLQRRAGLAVSLAVGAALPILAAVGYFALRGALPKAIEVFVLYNLSTYGNLGAELGVIDGWAAFLARPTVALLGPFVALGLWAARKQRQVLWPALGWLAALTLAVVWQGKYFFYHWMPTYAPLMFFAALGFHALAQGAEKNGSARIIAFGAALMFIGQVCAGPMHDAAKAVLYFGVKRSPQLYYNSFTYLVSGDPVFNAGDEVAAARYIDDHSKPSDGVFVWGNDAAVRYLADRPNPTRFTVEFPLSLPGSYRDAYRAEVIRDLRAKPPLYFVVGTNWWRPDTKAQALAKFPELEAYLKQGYRLETSFGAVDLYRRAAPEANAAAQ